MSRAPLIAPENGLQAADRCNVVMLEVYCITNANFFRLNIIFDMVNLTRNFSRDYLLIMPINWILKFGVQFFLEVNSPTSENQDI